MGHDPAWYGYTYLATHAVVQLLQLHTIHTELHDKSIIHESHHVSVCIGSSLLLLLCGRRVKEENETIVRRHELFISAGCRTCIPLLQW